MPVINTNVKKVTVEFDDGSTQVWVLPVEESGFVKEEYSYQAKEKGSGLNKWGQRIRLMTIFWTEVVDDLSSR